MSSLLKRLFGGIKVYFGKEFRYYTIIYLFFLIVIAIISPLFILLDIERLNNIELVYIIGLSSTVMYFLYIFLTLNKRMREIFFHTKWKYLLSIPLPIGGAIGFSFAITFLVELNLTVLYYIVTFILLGAFLIWLIIQLLSFGLFVKDFNIYLLEKIGSNSEKRNNWLVIFSILFQTAMIIYCVALRDSYIEITHLISFPFDVWLFPLICTILSGILLIVALCQKKYHSAFFTTSYIFLYSLFLLYHIGYLMLVIYSTEFFIGAINLLSLLIFTFLLFYTFQAVGGAIKTRLKRWWQPLSFFLFTIVLLYATWSVTFLYELSEKIADKLLELYFWSINHFISYIFGIVLLIITVFLFLGRLKRKKEVE